MRDVLSITGGILLAALALGSIWLAYVLGAKPTDDAPEDAGRGLRAALVAAIVVTVCWLLVWWWTA